MDKQFNKLPNGVILLIMEYLNMDKLFHEQERFIDALMDELAEMTSGCNTARHRLSVLESMYLLTSRENTRLKRKNRVLMNRMEVLEETLKKRKLTGLLDRVMDYESMADESETEVEIIDVSDFESSFNNEE